MPALDYCHPHIVHALEKDGWVVDDREVRVRTGERTVYIDLFASRQANGSRQQILLAEIKCFPDRNSTTRDLYIAVGQYIIYRAVLDEIGDTTTLYLVVPQTVYETIFDTAVRRAISDNRIKVLVINIDTERIVQWIE
jgi:hypothetical protein